MCGFWLLCEKKRKRTFVFHWGGLYPASHKTIKIGEHNGENVFLFNVSTLAPKKKTPSSDLFFLIAALQATLEYQKISENIFDS